MSAKRLRVFTCIDAAVPAARHAQVTEVSDLLTLAHSPTQLNQMVSAFLQFCPTAALESMTQLAERKGWSSTAIRASLWSRHLPWAMLDQIFLFLEIQELILAERICKRWRAASAVRGLGWSRDITLIKSPVMERQLRAPRPPTVANIGVHSQADLGILVPIVTSFPRLCSLVFSSAKCTLDGKYWQRVVAQLPALEEFRWVGTWLMSENIEHIGQLTKLHTLHLEVEPDDDPGDAGLEFPCQLENQAASRLATLPLTSLYLEGLSVSDNGLNQILSTCPLRKLSLCDPASSSPYVARIIDRLDSLVQLFIDRTWPLGSMPALQSLTLRHTTIEPNDSREPRFADRFPQLTQLSFLSCTIKDEDVIRSIEKLKSLKRLQFHQTLLEYPLVSVMEQLEVYSQHEWGKMHHNADLSLYAAVDCPKLKRLSVSGFGGSLDSHLLRRPRQLQFLSIADLGAEYVEILSSMRNLAATVTELSLTCWHNTTLTVANVKQFQNWSQLCSITIKLAERTFFKCRDASDAVKRLIQSCSS